ncbi:MAG: FeoB small GTPase domain-containing protein [Pyrinomonadaceae bacterium]
MTAKVQSSKFKVQSHLQKIENGNERKAGDKGQIIIALAGNPNAGKTTLFNALTGLRQKVANYPGVTVERKEGVWRLNGAENPARLIDLPGLYSLDALSLDEQIAQSVLTGKLGDLPKPDAVVAVVDATNLERNLYLVTQLLEFQIPVVVALTMVDAAEKQCLEIDTKKLSKLLNVPVVPVKAVQGEGIDELAEEALETVRTQKTARLPWLSTGDFLENSDSEEIHLSLTDDADINRKIFARYNFISEVYQETVKPKNTKERTISDKID